MENNSSHDSFSEVDSFAQPSLPFQIESRQFITSIDTPAFENNSQQKIGQDYLSQRKGRPCLYEGAEFPELLDKAKMILPTTNYDIEKLLELEEFKKLRYSRDLPRFLSKYILNKSQKKGSKSLKEKSIKSPGQSFNAILDYSNIDDQTSSYVPISTYNFSTQPNSTPQANYGAKIQSEITSNYLREYMLLKPSERYIFLEKICLRNSQSLLEFLINLKTTCSSNFYDGMFSLVHELNLNLQLELQIKTRLYVQSLLYYRNEKIDIDQNLLKSSMTLLAHRPNSEQTLGLANYIFINENETFSKLQDELVLLDSKNIGIIPLMAGTFTQYKIDPQVIRLLPNTLQCLTKPFIQILKQEFGLRLIRQIPVEVFGDFVEICALCQAKSYQDLDNLINYIKDIFIQKWDFLDQTDFSLLIAQISVELKERNCNWVGKISEVIDVVNKVMTIQLEKGIKNRPDIIFDLVNGNTQSIKQILKNPKLIDDFSSQQFYKMINKFKKLNKQNREVERYCNVISENFTFKYSNLIQMEDLLGFKFIQLQKLCLNFFSDSFEKTFFFNFGIGNGKTILCASLAIIAAQERKQSSIILGKNDYLVLRDEKKFTRLITGCGLNINSNQYEQRLGVYYLTQKYFEQQHNDEKFLKFLNSSTLIIDEFDWIIFDGTHQQMLFMIKAVKQAAKIVGLTGSSLTQKEETCLKAAFDVNQVKFPTLSTLKADKKIHLQDILFTSSQGEYCKYLYELCLKQTLLTPVLIVSSQSYSMIENYFKKFKELQFYSMKINKGSKTDAYLEEKFNVKNMNRRFEVFLLSEIQGRGTDLQSSREIEQNGGLYLVIADIFSKRSTEQIIGRVGRLENKGQWRQLIWQGNCQDTVEKAISCRQEIIENENHIRYSKLQTVIDQIYGRAEEQKIQNIEQEEQQPIYSFKQIKGLEISKDIGNQKVDEGDELQDNIKIQKQLDQQRNINQITLDLQDSRNNFDVDYLKRNLKRCYSQSLSDFSDISFVKVRNYTFDNELSDKDEQKFSQNNQFNKMRVIKQINKINQDLNPLKQKTTSQINEPFNNNEIQIKSRKSNKNTKKILKNQTKFLLQKE